MLRLYLARHGQTDWNKAMRLQGGADVPLNETGRMQAAVLARRLEGLELDYIYTSALCRARQTAAPLGDRAPMAAVVELNEQRLGKFEGSAISEAPGLREEFRRRIGDAGDALDGGESVNDHLARVRAGLGAILASHPEGTVLIIAHGGTNAHILRILCGLDHHKTRRLHMANDDLYLVEVSGDRPSRLYAYVPAERLEDR